MTTPPPSFVPFRMVSRMDGVGNLFRPAAAAGQFTAESAEERGDGTELRARPASRMTFSPQSGACPKRTSFRFCANVSRSWRGGDAHNHSLHWTGATTVLVLRVLVVGPGQ